MSGSPPCILYAEDDPAAETLFREALAEGEASADLETVGSGRAAVRTLDRRAAAGGVDPTVLLLDLDLGDVHGVDVIERVREDLGLGSGTLPIVVFSACRDRGVLRTAYRRGANTVVRKPDDLETLVDYAERIVGYWTIGTLGV
jgi:CheY-like chemotaxis protein